MYVTKIS